MPNNELPKSQEEIVVGHSWNSGTTLEPINNEAPLSIRESNKIRRSNVPKEEKSGKPTGETVPEISSEANVDVKSEKQEMLSLDNQITTLRERIEADGLFQQGELYLSKKKVDAAIEAFSKIITDYPYSDKAPKSHIRLGEIYIGEKEYYKASEILKEFIGDNREDSPEITKVCFLLAEALFAQYDHTRGGTIKLALNEAKANYEKVLKNSTSGEFFDKAKKRLIDCELGLANNDFFAVDFYDRTKQYRPALKRLSSMRVDFAGNKKIIKDIVDREPELLRKYKEQSKELGEIQMRKLKENLVRFWRDKGKLEETVSKLEMELSELEDKRGTVSKKGMGKYEKQLNEKRNEINESKQKIESLGREIVQAVGFIEDLNTNGYNPDLVPGKPDPDKKTCRIGGGAEFELDNNTLELSRNKGKLEKTVSKLEKELSELEDKRGTVSKKDMESYEGQLEEQRRQIESLKQTIKSLNIDIIKAVGIAVGSNQKPYAEFPL